MEDYDTFDMRKYSGDLDHLDYALRMPDENLKKIRFDYDSCPLEKLNGDVDLII